MNLGASSKGPGESKWDGVGEAEGGGMDTEEIEDADSRLGSGTMSVHEGMNKVVGGRGRWNGQSHKLGLGNGVSTRGDR